jgi:hypothetical protein
MPRQCPALHSKPAWQWSFEVQVVRHPIPCASQWYGVHNRLELRQVPCTLQSCPLITSVTGAQVVSPQGMPASALPQVPLGEPSALRSELHAWHSPSQLVAQHTRSTQ